MSILSQIGILILIGCIIFILIRSNKSLEKASEEGEHFVDEWALRQQKKEERKLEKEERRLEKTRRKQQKTDSRNRQSEELYEEEDDTWDDVSDDREIWNREEEDDARGDTSDSRDTWKWQEEDDARGDASDDRGAWNRDAGREKIISMHDYVNPGITLVQLDEAHRPTARVRVTKLPFTIGRSTENMLVLDDLCVARKHCRIVEKDGAYILEDVGTANKIFAGGAVTDHVILSDQLTFYIGNVEFRVEMGMGSRSEHTHLYQRAGERYYE